MDGMLVGGDAIHGRKLWMMACKRDCSSYRVARKSPTAAPFVLGICPNNLKVYFKTMMLGVP